jgi:circadian clock protein KaiC
VSLRTVSTITAQPDTSLRVSTGIEGLDEILGGGLPMNHLYLIDGEPGTGKTTLALQFLLAGAQQGARGLYVTLSESRAELAGVATSHGWSLDNIDVFELASQDVTTVEDYTLFHPAEIELQQTMDAVFASVERSGATLIVLDSLSEMRLLARDPLRFRRQILVLKQYFASRECTVLMLDDKTAPEGDLQLQSLAHGVIALEHVAQDYGSERRRLQVVKLRGWRFRGGYHDFRICTGGLAVYPRLRVDAKAPDDALSSVVQSGSRQLDILLGGGLHGGTSLLITGPAGTGKSTLASQYACAAVGRGERVLFYLFDERLTTFRKRSAGLGLDVDRPVEKGLLILRQIEPTQLSPGEFANQVMTAVEKDGVQMIVIDSLNGYLQSMPEERLLPIQVHELLSFLATRGVTCLMTLVQHGIFGSPVDEAAEISYLADTVVLLRYFEMSGSVRQAISVVKKRSGDHERSIREARVQKGGLHVGDALHEFHGVLTGVPTFMGATTDLLPASQSGSEAAPGSRNK